MPVKATQQLTFDDQCMHQLRLYILLSLFSLHSHTFQSKTERLKTLFFFSTDQTLFVSSNGLFSIYRIIKNFPSLFPSFNVNKLVSGLEKANVFIPTPANGSNLP